MLQGVGPPHGLVCQQGALMLHCLQEANSHFSIQSTRLCHLCGKDNRCQGPNCSNTREGKWSSLPDLILCLIKDKLDIIDDTRLTAVCRDWLSVSRFYSKKFTGGDGLPWIIQKTENKSEQEFISVTRKKKFTIDLPEFCDVVMLSSKDKWFLMQQAYSRSSATGGIVFLVNPFTKAKIKLPYIDPSKYYLGSFSTSEGYPCCVVLFHRCNQKVTIRTANLGDELWTEQSYIERGWQCRQYEHLLMIDEWVYCFDLSGKMLVYNMASHMWKEVPGSEGFYSSIMEFEGQILRVHRSSKDFNELSFFRYNDAETSWQTLNSDVVKDISWFLVGKWCFCLRTKHSKVYSVYGAKIRSHFLLNYGVNNPNFEYERSQLLSGGLDIVVHDLMDGSITVLDLPYRISTLANWVDIG